MIIPSQTNENRPLKVIAFWMGCTMLAVWLVASLDLRAFSIPVLFPSGRGISNAMHDPNLGAWACNISLLLGIFCAVHLSVYGLKPHQAKVRTQSQFWTELVPLTLLITGLLAFMLTADLHPGTGEGRRSALFHALSTSTFGISVLASLLTFFFGFLIFVPLQTVRVGFRLLRSSAE